MNKDGGRHDGLNQSGDVLVGLPEGSRERNGTERSCAYVIAAEVRGFRSGLAVLETAAEPAPGNEFRSLCFASCFIHWLMCQTAL